MSMLTIGKDEIDRRKAAVEEQDLYDGLTVGNKTSYNPRVADDQLKDKLNTEPKIDSLDYFNELLKDND